MDNSIYMNLRSRGYMTYLARIIAMAYDKTKAEKVDGFIERGLEEKDVYAYIINSCINRQRVIHKPRSQLIKHTINRQRLKKDALPPNSLKKQNNEESNFILRFLEQGFDDKTRSVIRSIRNHHFRVR